MPAKSLDGGKDTGKDTGKGAGQTSDGDESGYVTLNAAEYAAAKKLGEKSAAAFAAENNGRMPPGWG